MTRIRVELLIQPNEKETVADSSGIAAEKNSTALEEGETAAVAAITVQGGPVIGSQCQKYQRQQWHQVAQQLGLGVPVPVGVDQIQKKKQTEISLKHCHGAFA